LCFGNVYAINFTVSTTDKLYIDLSSAVPSCGQSEALFKIMEQIQKLKVPHDLNNSKQKKE
jgi:glutaredoxin-related protein